MMQYPGDIILPNDVISEKVGSSRSQGLISGKLKRGDSNVKPLYYGSPL